MPDLEPITRDEKLWSGEDLEPITRREMYIKHLYDETQVIPDKPITREEMFILKAGEELHDVTIEQLNVTENGTYSEAGKAYSPVIVEVPEPTLTTLDVTENGTYTAPSGTAYNEVDVNVPLPENAYLLKDIEGTPSDIATFTDGSALPMPKLEIAVEPQQEGSGDPSPTNIRPISGWDEVNVVVSPTTDAEDGHTYTIQLGDTYYGGKLDVVSGVLTVDWKAVDFNTLTWTYQSDYSRLCANVTNIIQGDGARTVEFINSDYRCLHNGEEVSQIHDGDTYTYGNTVFVHDSRYTDGTAFKNATTAKMVYPMATPLTIQLTPTQVNSLEGVNNIFADCGNIIDGQYFGKEV